MGSKPEETRHKLLRVFSQDTLSPLAMSCDNKCEMSAREVQ